ncbi:MAG TPA: LysM domain-containing protein [Terriglobales bacterium]|nr:LysM domain-containing protein [Terriglobales bacterium]
MGNPFTISSYPAPYNFDGDFSPAITVNPQAGKTLLDIAQALKVDPNALAKANPQIDPRQALTPFQQIRVPESLHPQMPVPYADPAPAGPPPSPSLPPKPLGTSEDATAMKAKLANMDGTPRQSPATYRSVNYSNTPEFKALPQEVQERLLQATAKDPAAEQHLQEVVQNPLYSQLSTKQRTELLNVFAGANDEGRQELVQLMGRHLPTGQPALLSTDNSPNHATLLDNLNNLANEPLHSSVSNRRSEILSQVIDDAAEPTWYMDQGPAGTCACTSHQTGLLINSPAEYARLLGGLFGPDRKATLANGDDMFAAKNDVVSHPVVTPLGGGKPRPDTRSLTERVFQSAIAQYAYMNSGHVPAQVDANKDIPGLTLQESAAALSGLYGKKYQVLNDPSNTAATMDAVEKELAAGRAPVPVSLQWGNGSYHMVLVDHISTDTRPMKVYIRNPWGSAAAEGKDYTDGKQIGTAANNTAYGPRRTVADHQSGLEVMTYNDFSNSIDGAVVQQK